jgi:hypothetical protein
VTPGLSLRELGADVLWTGGGVKDGSRRLRLPARSAFRAARAARTARRRTEPTRGGGGAGAGALDRCASTQGGRIEKPEGAQRALSDRRIAGGKDERDGKRRAGAAPALFRPRRGGPRPLYSRGREGGGGRQLVVRACRAGRMPRSETHARTGKSKARPAGPLRMPGSLLLVPTRPDPSPRC